MHFEPRPAECPDLAALTKLVASAALETVGKDQRTMRSRRRRLAALPDLESRTALIRRDARFRSHALGFALLREAQVAPDRERALEACFLLHALAAARREHEPADRIAADLAAGAWLVAASSWSQPEELERAWRFLGRAAELAGQGTQDVSLATWLATERAALERDRGCLELALGGADRARRAWLELGDTDHAAACADLVLLIEEEVAAACMAVPGVEPYGPRWPASAPQATFRQLLRQTRFDEAADLLRRRRRRLAGRKVRKGPP